LLPTILWQWREPINRGALLFLEIYQ